MRAGQANRPPALPKAAAQANMPAQKREQSTTRSANVANAAAWMKTPIAGMLQSTVNSDLVIKATVAAMDSILANGESSVCSTVATRQIARAANSAELKRRKGRRVPPVRSVSMTVNTRDKANT